MKAIILAAGRGNRMKEGTLKMPKCMIRLFNKPLIEHCINSLEMAGFSRQDIGIVTGYRKEQINVGGVTYFFNQNWFNTSVFFSLTQAKEWLRKETCIVSYSDILFLPSIIKELINIGSNIAITYYEKYWELWEKRFSNPFDDLETFKVDKNKNKLIEIGYKTNSRSDIQGQYMGLLRFSPKGWQNVEIMIKKTKQSIEELDITALLQLMVINGYWITAIPTNEFWLECDNQNDINLYEKEFYNIYKKQLL